MFDKVDLSTYNLAGLLKELEELGIIERVLEEDKYSINPTVRIPQSLGFEDVAIQQAENKCKSRLQPSLRSEVVRGMYLDVPLIAANMSTVMNEEMACKLDELGALGVLHRAYPAEKISEYIDLVRELRNKKSLIHLKNEQVSYRHDTINKIVAASVGVGPSQIELAAELYNAGADIIVIDIAHGYSEFVKETAQKIKQQCPFVKIVVGNTHTLDALYYFDDVADALKVGLSNGLACETAFTAGCNEGQFSSVLKFKSEAKRLGMPIISDGGIRIPSDFVKAIGAGANAVMAGSIFARCPESAAEVVDGKKIYAGMASRYVQDKWKGGLKPGTCPEGKVVELELGEPVDKLIERYAGALRSGITYAGAKTVPEFQEKVEFVRV